MLGKKLAIWYARAKRDLPWRRSNDPWAIWVSEVMLQQTRVEAVREAWSRFLERYRQPAALAQASDDELLAAWRGLGYYRRARALREAARRVVDEHGGEVPRDADAFGALPGVGDYTKGAVLSIAFDQALPAVDGNVERVASRLLALDGEPGRSPWSKRVRELVADLQQAAAPSVINQALMELGAIVCTPKRPSCLVCPLRADCAALRNGDVEKWPIAKPRPRPIDVATEVCVVRRGNRMLCRRIPAGEINEGQLCLPGLGLPVPVGDDLCTRVAELGLRGRVGPRLATVRHSITRYRIRIDAFAFIAERVGSSLIWAHPADASIPLSTVARKIWRKLPD